MQYNLWNKYIQAVKETYASTMQNTGKSIVLSHDSQNMHVHRNTRAEVPNTHMSKKHNFLNLIFQMGTRTACTLCVALGKFKLLNRHI